MGTGQAQDIKEAYRANQRIAQRAQDSNGSKRTGSVSIKHYITGSETIRTRRTIHGTVVHGWTRQRYEERKRK